VGIARDCASFFFFLGGGEESTPIMSGKGEATDFKFASEGQSEQKHIKNFAEKGAWAYPATAQHFWVPLLSQERVKL